MIILLELMDTLLLVSLASLDDLLFRGDSSCLRAVSRWFSTDATHFNLAVSIIM